MDKQQAREFRERWRRVNEYAAQEDRSTTVQERWRQFVALLDPELTVVLHASTDDDQTGRAGWTRLRVAHKP